MRLDPTKLYMMPQIMGPLYEKEDLPKIQYPQSESIGIQFLTEVEAVRALVPDCYDVAQEVVVKVVFGYHKGIEFLAGGAYNIATVQVASVFDGEKDHVEGDFILVMFENQTRPIILGREFLGVPKIYADIPSPRIMLDGNLRCEASFLGHLLFGIDLPPMKKQNRLIRNLASKQINSRPWLAYKYIPSFEDPPDADYPTLTRNDIEVESFWMGNAGSLYFGTATKDDIGPTVGVLDALRSIPFIELKQSFHIKGSAVLRVDQSRRLR